MTANSYPGNPSLPSEVRQRVLATFRQTLDLFDEGRLDEVVAGCELLLDMDSRFEPAEKLREKAMDPSAPIDLGPLYALVGKADGAAPEGPEGTSDELMAAVEAISHRDFQTAIDLCNAILADDPNNEQAQQLGEKALERLEAAPFVEQFISESRAALEQGNLGAARTGIEKARTLDPTHPEVTRLQSEIDLREASGGEAPEAPAPVSFDFGADGLFSDAFSGTPADSPEPVPASPQERADEDSSFVVERSGETTDDAVAADFGFIFEEAPPAEVAGTGSTPVSDESSFDEPSPSVDEPPVGEAHTFDFSGEVEVSDDDRSRVEKYLAEGDAAAERGDLQEAIDIWSRIFLIDVTNEDASSRIEAAKKKRLEIDRKVEDLMLDAARASEQKDYAAARALYEQVLAVDAANTAAIDALDKLGDLEAALGRPARSTTSPGIPMPETEPPRAAPELTLPSSPPALDLDDDLSDYAEPAAAPPPPPVAEEPSLAAPSIGTGPKRIRLPLGAIAAVVGIVALAAAGWFAYRYFFAGSDGELASIAETEAKIEEAETLAAAGELGRAIQVLLSIRAQDPNHERALEMIAELKARQQRESGVIGGRPAQQVFQELVEKGKSLFRDADYVAAKQAFEEASAIQQLPPDARDLYDVARQKVGRLDHATVLFREGNYVEAISTLREILQEDPQHRNARQMLVNAHYNLGALALKESRLDEAIVHFDQVLAENPNDEMARRSRDLAARYQGEAKDLLFRTYVKYLPLR